MEAVVDVDIEVGMGAGGGVCCIEGRVELGGFKTGDLQGQADGWMEGAPLGWIWIWPGPGRLYAQVG
jgi:hypothetical protein